MGGGRRGAYSMRECTPNDLVAAAAVRARVSRRKASRRLAFAAASAAANTMVDDRPLTPEADLIAAVSSLYDDQLRPYGRLVRKRLAELAAANNQLGADGDLSRLRKACEASQWMQVQPEDGGEWCALLIGRSPFFVDIYTGPDVYPEEMWRDLAMYLETLNGEDGVLPGGRYSCALALWQFGLPCLAGRSLGEVCHIVQLAMSDRKLLGYLDGTIAPYSRSQSMMKDAAAEQCVHNTMQQLPLASWTTARTCLKEVLDSAVRKGKHEVPLSNLKRLFRSRFHAELSETALGYTKISDLLQDPQLSDICSVQLLERGYVVRPRASMAHFPGRHRHIPLRLERSARHQCIPNHAVSMGIAGKTSSRSKPQLSPLQLPAVGQPRTFAPNRFAPTLSPDSLSKEGCIGRVVRNTFIHTTEERAEGSSRRARSLPKDMGSVRSLWETSCHVLAFMPRPVEDRSSARSGDESSTDVPMSPTGTASPVWTPRAHSLGVASSYGEDAPLSPTLTASPLWTPRHPSADICLSGSDGLLLPSVEQLDNAYLLHAMGGAFASVGGAMVSYNASTPNAQGTFEADDCFAFPCDNGFGMTTFSPQLHAVDEKDLDGTCPEAQTANLEQCAPPCWSPRCAPGTQDDAEDLANKIPLCLAHFV